MATDRLRANLRLRWKRRIRTMNSIAKIFELIWRDSSMKKDCEIPWYLRVGRWAVVVFGIAYGALLIIEKAKSVL